MKNNKMRYIFVKSFIVTSIIFFGTAHGNEEAKSVLDAVLQAYEVQLTDFGTGMGNGTILQRKGPTGGTQEEKKLDVRFWYKNEARRTDYFESDAEADTPKRIKSSAENSEVRLSYNPQRDSASIFPSDLLKHYGTLGKDFHPSTLLSGWDSLPMYAMLKIWKEKDADLDHRLYTKPTREGFVELTAKSEKKETFQNKVFDIVESLSFVFDPNNAFRPISCRLDLQNREGPGSLIVVDAKIQWFENTNRIGYPKSIRFYCHTKVSDAEIAKGPPEGVDKTEWQNYKDQESYMEINIKEFQQDIEIDDKLFTLEGMGITDATFINDHILGTKYRNDSANNKTEMKQTR